MIPIVFILIVAASGVRYVEEGALLTQPGTFQLNNPSPLTVRINNYEQCSESPVICYPRNASSFKLYEECDVNFCSMRPNLIKKMSELGSAVVDGDSLIFTQKEDSPCMPDVRSGLNTYQIDSLPKHCETIIVGATQPATTDVSTTTQNVSETVETNSLQGPCSLIVIIIIMAAVIVALIIIIVLLYRSYVYKPRMQKRVDQRSSEAVLGENVEQPLMNSVAVIDEEVKQSMISSEAVLDKNVEQPLMNSVDVLTENVEQPLTNNLQPLPIHDLLIDTCPQVVINVKGVTVKINKMILTSLSPVFNAMFSHDTEEAKTGCVKIDDFDYTTVNNVKSFCLEKNLDNLTTDECIEMLKFADKYIIQGLQEYLESILSDCITIDNICKVATYAWTYSRDDVKAKCAQYILTVGSGFVFTTACEELDPNIAASLVEAAVHLVHK